VSQSSLSGEVRSHLLNDPRGRWHHTKSDPASAIDDGFAVHENFVLTVAATDLFHLDSEFTTEPCRHTDGMEARHSERAIPNRYSSHLILP
jgi:hypothetical protein